MLSTAVLPILKYLGKKALTTGINIGTDVLQGDNIKGSLKKRLKSTGFDILEDGFEKVKKYKQSGSGRRRRRMSKRKTTKRKKSKRKPSLLQLKALAKGRNILKRKSRKSKKSKKNKKKQLSLF